jgi:hypothetical protein
MKPQIIVGEDTGFHNAKTQETIDRMIAQGAYKDLSTIVLVPCFGQIPTKVVASWMNMYSPPNQGMVRLWGMGMEVGESFNAMMETILANPQLAKFKYIMTLEHDNTVQPDTLVNLLSAMHDHPEYSAISALYYTKGYGGVAQCWGDINDPVINFRPVPPRADGGILETYGTGMGCVLWRMDMFKDARFEGKWFKTCADQTNGCFTQDLYFWNNARKYGYRCAVHCGVKSGHYDLEGKFSDMPDFTW